MVGSKQAISAIDKLNDMVSIFCNNSQWNYEKEMHLAIEALELRVAKKPIEKASFYGDTVLICPNCTNSGIVDLVSKTGCNCCPQCGQQLDWEGLNIKN